MTKSNFLFATGIENSVPTINGGRTRVDQMAVSDHYARWRDDFAAVSELGIDVLRYGPPILSTWRGPGRYDWTFADETYLGLQQRGIVPITDLCHFGLPDWLGNFQNPDLPRLFADYARAFAERYPWVQLYTPMNEMFITAQFSAKMGWWNEQATDDRSFVTALKNIVAANRLAMEEIVKVRPDALFIQSESSEHFHADTPDAMDHAEMLNHVRFLPLDLNYGHPVAPDVYEWLCDNGMTRADRQFFGRATLNRHCVMGNDYYWTNEHRVGADGSKRASGEVLGYAEITRQYHSRYGLPFMHTETNLDEGPLGTESADWLWKQWTSVLRLRASGLPVLGFTWYSLTDQVDWDIGLREVRGTVNPRGLYDLDRNIRNAGRAYKELVGAWRGRLESLGGCMGVHVAPVPAPEPVRLAVGWA
jgi:beta-glucosidase/6-phospho-beta-glucosidase/beta-galactosidase